MASTRTATQLLPVILCLSTPAWAEGERAVSAGVGPATFVTPAEPVEGMEPTTVSAPGGSIGISYEHSVSSDFSLRGELAGAIFYGGNTEAQSAVSYAGLVDVGATFRFDVLKYVPYAFGGVGALFTSGGPITRDPQPVLVVGGGLDILLSRQRSWGFEARLASFLGDVTVFTFNIRGTHRWGYF